ncbi:hypothetical protein FJT64_020288 [Amphibalanus amphitrite]|uniref:RNase H type-1 domain-containing protein n=1 Tax=Amphibalanus amphitrite TaxID=1232801 RepID=A0A6A4X275_AMPAM|nr:hypothetical protein FJT64_020288 [Amphibalanus amphitrite]
MNEMEAQIRVLKSRKAPGPDQVCTEHLRHLGPTAKDQEAQLRTVANGYVRGALEHAAAPWLPAASEAHVELIERELRAAARAVTGCTASTPTAPLMAEAGITPARVRCPALAASLPGDDPLRAVGEMHVAPRLRTTTGWCEVGHRALAWTGAADVKVEGRPTKTIPLWDHHGEAVTFCLDVGPGGQRAAPAHIRRRAAEATLEHLPPRATWIWSDGSVEGGVSQGGGGATVTLPSGETREVRVPASQLCSSTRAELCALKAALNAIRDADADIADNPIVICTDSQAALRMLESGASAQTTHLLYPAVKALFCRSVLENLKKRAPLCLERNGGHFEHVL